MFQAEQSSTNPPIDRPNGYARSSCQEVRETGYQCAQNNGLNGGPGFAIKLEPVDPYPEDSLNLPTNKPDNEHAQLEGLRPLGPEDNCNLNPEFAVICSYIALFGDKIDIELNIEQLKSSLEDQTRLYESLIDIHVKLLKKTRKYFVRDQWEKALIRFAFGYSYEDACEIENIGYQRTRPSIKMQLLRRLFDAQFECDSKFKATVNALEANELRILPFGRDIQGNTYWQRTDSEGNIRIFQEQPLDHESWKTVCASSSDLDKLIDELEKSKDHRVKGEPMLEPYNPLPKIFPEYFAPKQPQGVSLLKKPTTLAKKIRSRTKKSSLALPTLKEEEPEQNDASRTHDRNVDKAKTESEITGSTNRQTQLTPSLQDHSVESQVKSALENLIGRVVASIDYIIRPLSKNSDMLVQKNVTANEKPRRRKFIKKEKSEEEYLPRRTSSRIQQLQQKKMAEQQEESKKLIESTSNKNPNAAISSLDDDSKGSTAGHRNHGRSESPENATFQRRKRRKGQSWRRGKGKKKLSWDKDDSDLSSTSSLTESNDDDFGDADESFKFDANNYDDEFACEEEETNIEPVIVKRARTARQSATGDELSVNREISSIEEDKPCGRCDGSNDPEWILLCDMCDDGYHTTCCLPPLMMVPDGDWFCPMCEHKMLLTKLSELNQSIKSILEEKAREHRKKQKLRQNTVKREPTRREVQEKIPGKRQRNVLDDLNEPITLQELDQDLQSDRESLAAPHNKKSKTSGKRCARSKRYAKRRSRNSRGEDFGANYKKSRRACSRKDTSESSSSEESSVSDESESSEDFKPKTRRACASVSYRFQEYDELIRSAIRGDSNEDSSSKESVIESCNYGRGKDMATIEALAYQQENGFVEQSTVVDDDKTVSRQKSKKRGRRLNDLDAISESDHTTSDESFQASSATDVEDEDDDDLTEADSHDESDTSIDELVSLNRSKRGKKHHQRCDSDTDTDHWAARARRAASMRVSYKESSDDDDTEFVVSEKRIKKVTLSSDEDSQASWKSGTKSTAEDDRSTSCGELLESQDSLDDLNSEDPIVPQVVIKKDNHSIPEEFDSTVRSSVETQQTPSAPPGLQSNPSLNESIDEIIAPIYRERLEAAAAREKVALPNQRIKVKDIPPKESEPERARDPIQELNQYCTESVSASTMFNSYNETLSNKSVVQSPVHPPFYEDEVIKPASVGDRAKKQKKSKIASKASESISKKATDSHHLERGNQGINLEHNSAKIGQPTPPARLPSLQALAPSSARFRISSPSSVTQQVYPIHPVPISYTSNTFPGKYSQQPHASHIRSYQHSYQNPLNSFTPQQPRSGAPIQPYPSPHLQSSILYPISVTGPPPRQSIPSTYYSTAGTVPNSNFSIHQLLNNPYSMTALPQQPSLSQPMNSALNSLSASQQTPNSTQSSNADGSISESFTNTDKDTIRGMSDVISFIGDT